MITDSHGRIINYLRIAVTDRCNLRCTYCMPHNGLDWLPHKELMTYEEMLRVCSLLVKMGVEKIRITGGEPFIRKDLMCFLESLSGINGLKELTITTNGLLTAPFAGELKSLGIQSVNLSLDTLDEQRFRRITRRDGLDKVLKTLEVLLLLGIAVKINAVVMEDHNIADIIPLVQLTKTLPVMVRFIEEMPFNGGSHNVSLKWNYQHILQHIREHFPGTQKAPDTSHATSVNYHVPGHKGHIGIIAAYSRTFCGSCNRIRITPAGMMRTCLYDAGNLNVKEVLRNGGTDTDLEAMIREALLQKPSNGWDAAHLPARQQSAYQSMATIGG